MFSLFQHLCRRVYCPAGEFMVACKCIQPFKMVFGMPVLLTVKVIPRSGYLTTMTTKQIHRYHDTLKKTLHAISENISIEFIGLFECKADPDDYYLSLVVVRSYPGCDTKEMLEPFLNYLDNKRKIEMDFKQTTYIVKLSSRIRLWTWHKNLNEYRLKFQDLESKVQNHSILFESNDIFKAYDQEFQVLSPLLYCMQIQLNDTEFEEQDEQLTTLRTYRKIKISYYRRTSTSTVRVCMGQYMNKRASNIGMKVSHSKFYLYVLLMIRCGPLFVF